MKNSILMGLVAFALVSATPFASAECVEAAGSSACVTDYSSNSVTSYGVNGQLMGDTFIYGSFGQGEYYGGTQRVHADGSAYSRTADTYVFAAVVLIDKTPSDNMYERGIVYNEFYVYDGSYEWGYVYYSDRNGDGVPDVNGIGYYASFLP